MLDFERAVQEALLARETVWFPYLGKLYPRHYPAKQRFNVQKGATLNLPPRDIVRFKNNRDLVALWSGFLASPKKPNRPFSATEADRFIGSALYRLQKEKGVHLEIDNL